MLHGWVNPAAYVAVSDSWAISNIKAYSAINILTDFHYHINGKHIFPKGAPYITEFHS